MSKIAFEAVRTACLDFQPDLKTLDVEYMVTFSRKSLDSFMLGEVLQANVTT